MNLAPDPIPTHAELDAFRAVGDPALDELVAALPPHAVGELLGSLFRSAASPDTAAGFRALSERLLPVPLSEPERIQAGQELFQLFGPEILLVLGCYALPAAYAAGNGVQAIHRARRLKDDGTRRLTETAQMVLNVMYPGGLEPDGVGARSARKVRLMHALVRQHVRTMPGVPWSESFGVPINQEDLAGTLLTFSLVVIDGLRRMGALVSEAAEQGYFSAWRHIGTLLGVDARLLPGDFATALRLGRLIAERQFRPTPEGRALTRELVTVVDALFPVRGYGLSTMHFFLDGSVFGTELAQLLDLPTANWTSHLVRLRAAQKRSLLRWLPRVPGAERRRRSIASFFAQRLILLQRPDARTPFEIPHGHETAAFGARAVPPGSG